MAGKDLTSKEDKIREALLDHFQHSPQPDVVQRLISSYVALTGLQQQREAAKAQKVASAKAAAK